MVVILSVTTRTRKPSAYFRDGRLCHSSWWNGTISLSLRYKRLSSSGHESTTRLSKTDRTIDGVDEIDPSVLLLTTSALLKECYSSQFIRLMCSWLPASSALALRRGSSGNENRKPIFFFRFCQPTTTMSTQSRPAFHLSSTEEFSPGSFSVCRTPSAFAIRA